MYVQTVINILGMYIDNTLYQLKCILRLQWQMKWTVYVYYPQILETRRNACRWRGSISDLETSTNKFYIRGQCKYIVLILQCKKSHTFVKSMGKTKTHKKHRRYSISWFIMGESNWRTKKNNEEKNPKLLFVLFKCVISIIPRIYMI